MQLKIINSPFNQEQAELLNKLLPTMSETQKVWLSGYLAASQYTTSIDPQGVQAGEHSIGESRQAISKEVTILYGSQTGNSKRLAENAGKTLSGSGFQVSVLSMASFKPTNLKKLENLLIIVSTHGEGDPPDQALTLHEFLHGRRAPKLDNLNFSVLALGDSSYEFFCQTGKDFDTKLEELGGKRLYPRFDCDLDYDEPAIEWLEGVLSNLSEVSGGRSTLYQVPQAQAAESNYSRTNPFVAEILENINLNGRGSNKETRHLELSLEGSGLTYEPGDSLGVFPENNVELVDQLVEELNWNSEELVTVNKQGDVLPFKKALTSYYEITVVTKPLLKKIGELINVEALRLLFVQGNEEKLKTYLTGRDLLDVVRDFGPWGKTPQEFVSILRKLPARLYSIASSISANPEEVHLTIGAVRYNAHGRERKGVCSIFCAEVLQPGDTLKVYIQKNENFKLPENPNTPIIMVGPGTGIAPFRSFMQEREEKGAQGRSWLFFGDQHFVTDFLYQTEWQKWLKDGVLTKMDVAFSRDGAEKIYVQHRMLEESKEIYKWLQDGAVVYICGDEQNMAHDVHEALLAIIEKESGLSRQNAEDYLANLQQEKRYQRDVY